MIQMDERPSRRRFLRGAGLTGAALAIGNAVLPLDRLLSAAGAQEAAPPTAPEFAAFAETLELAAAAMYGPLRAKVSRPAAVGAITAYQRHHQDHASAIGAAAGDKRVGRPNPLLLQTLTDQLNRAGDENAALRVALDLENGIAATYLFIVHSIEDPGVLKLAASVLPIEAQHAVALGMLLGRPVKELTAPDGDQRGFESEEKRLDIATFPPVVTTTTGAAEEA